MNDFNKYVFLDRDDNWHFKYDINPYVHVGYNYFNERCEEPNEPAYSAWAAGLKLGFKIGEQASKWKIVRDSIASTC